MLMQPAWETATPLLTIGMRRSDLLVLLSCRIRRCYIPKKATWSPFMVTTKEYKTQVANSWCLTVRSQRWLIILWQSIPTTPILLASTTTTKFKRNQKHTQILQGQARQTFLSTKLQSLAAQITSSKWCNRMAVSTRTCQENIRWGRATSGWTSPCWVQVSRHWPLSSAKDLRVTIIRIPMGPTFPFSSLTKICPTSLPPSSTAVHRTTNSSCSRVCHGITWITVLLSGPKTRLKRTCHSLEQALGQSCPRSTPINPVGLNQESATHSAVWKSHKKVLICEPTATHQTDPNRKKTSIWLTSRTCHRRRRPNGQSIRASSKTKSLLTSRHTSRTQSRSIRSTATSLSKTDRNHQKIGNKQHGRFRRWACRTWHSWSTKWQIHKFQRLFSPTILAGTQ